MTTLAAVDLDASFRVSGAGTRKVVQVISTRQHGVVDYLFAASTYALPRVLPASERARALLTGSSLGVVGMSALTDYELGLVKVLPMKGHVALDLALGALLVAAPLLLHEEDGRVRAALAGMGALGAVVALLTET